jgi:hypothetical protein
MGLCRHEPGPSDRQGLRLTAKRTAKPGATSHRPMLASQVVELVSRPIRVELPKRTFRQILALEDKTQVPILRDPEVAAEDAEAVFYFPGCGSERLFSDVGLATLAMLYEQGAQTVLPPGYLCCGYPQRAAGLEDRGRQITMENRVLFHRVANTLNYLDIRTVVVSCGTCMDQLLKYEFERIFPGCRLLDIHEWLMEKGVSLKGVEGVQYLYHDPCHSPMKTHAPLKVARSLIGQPVMLSDRCCGEAGTLGTARPDIANQVRFRKQEELTAGIQALTGKDVRRVERSSCSRPARPASRAWPSTPTRRVSRPTISWSSWPAGSWVRDGSSGFWIGCREGGSSACSCDAVGTGYSPRPVRAVRHNQPPEGVALHVLSATSRAVSMFTG